MRVVFLKYLGSRSLKVSLKGLQDEDERIYDLGDQSKSQNGALELGRVGGSSMFIFL